MTSDTEAKPVAWLGAHGNTTTDEAVAGAWETSFNIGITPLFTNPSSIRNAALDEAIDVVNSEILRCKDGQICTIDENAVLLRIGIKLDEMKSEGGANHEQG